MVPGILYSIAGSLNINVGRETVVVKVTNCADRPIQVGSHYHFIEANSALEFDRRASYGKRLNMCVVQINLIFSEFSD